MAVRARAEGLSPFARGNHGHWLVVQRGGGPIPVRTGEPRPRTVSTGPMRAYPRSHGGTTGAKPQYPALSGLSPFARGNLDDSGAALNLAGPIPVRTGEPITARPCAGLSGAYPRSHGGTAVMALRMTAVLGLSPFARGNLTRLPPECQLPGPIPVRTGEPGLKWSCRTA